MVQNRAGRDPVTAKRCLRILPSGVLGMEDHRGSRGAEAEKVWKAASIGGLMLLVGSACLPMSFGEVEVDHDSRKELVHHLLDLYVQTVDYGPSRHPFRAATST